MAKNTTHVTVSPTVWTALSVAGNTRVKVQVPQGRQLRVGIADAAADLLTGDGHWLIADKIQEKFVDFEGLSGTKVLFAKIVGVATPVTVTNI